MDRFLIVLASGLVAMIVCILLSSCSNEFAEDRCGNTLPMVIREVKWCSGFGTCQVVYEDGTVGVEPNPILGTASKKKCRAE